jgi:hypothetical protein
VIVDQRLPLYFADMKFRISYFMAAALIAHFILPGMPQ